MISNWLRGFAVLLLAVNVAACGGGGSFSGSSSSTTTPTPPPDGDPTPVVPADSLTLMVSSASMPSDGSQPVTLTARARNSSLKYLKDVKIDFMVVSGNAGLTIISAITNDSGMATAQLDTNGDATVRTITVIAQDATSKITSAAQSVNVVGTTLSVSGPGDTAAGSKATLAAVLKDFGGKGIAGETVTITSTAGSTVGQVKDGPVVTAVTGGFTIKTTASGQVAFTVTPPLSASGKDTITISALGVSKEHVITIAPYSFNFTSPAADPISQVAVNTDQPVTACLKNGAVGVTGVTFNFSATRGAVTPASGITDAAGCVTVNLNSTQAGLSTIAAYGTKDLNTYEASLVLECVATTPSTLTLQAGLTTLALGQETAVSALVLDSNKNPVKGKRVRFEQLVDTSGGVLKQVYATTDSSGVASVTYKAGTAGTAKNGVSLFATVEGYPAANGPAFLTVTGQSLHVALGTSNIAYKYGAKESARVKPYMAVVTDSAGKPVANQDVSFTLWSRRFLSGKHFPVYSTGGGFAYWGAEPDHSQRPVAYKYSLCSNEDTNRNGILDAGEDISRQDFNSNGVADDAFADGMLNPGNISGLGIGAVSSKTGNDGTLEFDVIYPASYADWLEVELEAKIVVAGTESMARAIFFLPGLAEDYMNEKIRPPGYVSPFGLDQYFGTNCQQK